MSPVSPFRVLALLAALLTIGSFAEARPIAQSSRSLNVLVILSDQHNARALGATENGFGGMQGSLTPNLDALANEGVLFERAYCATPQCQPSRFSLLTGRMPHSHGVRWNRIWQPRNQYLLTDLFRSNGYVTGTIGKHHLYWLEQPLPRVEDHGFDEIVDATDYRRFCQQFGIPPHSALSRVVEIAGLAPALAYTGYTLNTDRFHPSGYWASRVIQFLDDRAGGGGDNKPFLLFYAPEGPHNPLLPSGPADPNDWAHKYRPPGNLGLAPNRGKIADTSRLAQLQSGFTTMTAAQWRETLASYYGLLSQIDHGIGRVLNKLDELGIANNTLVIYTSDHGEMMGEMDTWTKGGGNFEAVARVPLIARLPGVLPAGVRTEALTTNIDLFPTLADIAGLTVPDAVARKLEGRSFVPAWAAAPALPTDWREEVFVEFGLQIPNIALSRTVVRQNTKYDFDERNGGEEQFFNLVADPDEITNLIGTSDGATLAQIAQSKLLLANWWNDERGHAPHYFPAGDMEAIPALADGAIPRNGAFGMSRDEDLRWIPSPAAHQQGIWFGTSPTSLTQVAVVGTMARRYNLGSLAANTTYYWRIDGANQNGTRVGTVWSFRTDTSGDGGPDLALDPAPAVSQEDVSRNNLLSWTPPIGATSQDVWIARGTGPLIRVATGLSGNQSTFDPGPFDRGIRVRWRVDATNAQGTTAGDLWSFRTSTANLPEPARAFFPKHLRGNIDFAALGTPPFIGWHSGAGATDHDVYFGDSWPPTFRGTTNSTRFFVGTLSPNTTYWWRIDERNAEGVSRGPRTWRFTTGP